MDPTIVVIIRVVAILFVVLWLLSVFGVLDVPVPRVRYPMSAGTLAPNVFPRLFDNDGFVLAGGFIYTYLAGTTTPTSTYTDANLTVPNTNPIVLSAGGTYTAYLPANSQKWILKDASGVTLATVDPVGSIGLVTSGVYDIFSFFGDPTSPISATSYPSGATFDKCHAGTTIFSIDSANLASGTYKITGMVLNAAGVATTVAIVNLSDGSPDTPLATMSSTSTTGDTAISGAISFAAGGTTKTYGIKTQVSSGVGFAWGIQLIKVS